MTRWPRLPRRGVGVGRWLCACDFDARSGSVGAAAGGMPDISRGTRGNVPGCFLIFEAADRVMDVPADSVCAELMVGVC